MSDIKINAKEIKVLHSFYDNTIAPSYIYQWEERPGKLISWWIQAPILIDLNGDGIKDIVLPVSKGYATGADKFSYNVGGNITKGDKGADLTFTEFAEVFGVYDILNSSGAQTGAIADMYII